MVSKLLVSFMAPDFNVEIGGENTTFHRWLGCNWGLIYSHYSDFCPKISDNDLKKVTTEHDTPNLKILGFARNPTNELKFVVNDFDSKISRLYTNSSEEKVIYLIDAGKKVEFAFSKVKVQGITKFSSSHLAGSGYDYLIEKIFGKIWI